MNDSTHTAPSWDGWSPAALAELRDIAAAMLADSALLGAAAEATR